MTKLGSFIPLVVLLAILMIGVSYIFGILSANNDIVNVEGTEYEKTYDTNVAIQNATSAIISPVGLIIGVLILLVVLGGFRSAIRR